MFFYDLFIDCQVGLATLGMKAWKLFIWYCLQKYLGNFSFHTFDRKKTPNQTFLMKGCHWSLYITDFILLYAALFYLPVYLASQSAWLNT